MENQADIPKKEVKSGENKVFVTYVADDNVALGLYVSVFSILKKLIKKRKYLVLVVDVGLSKKSREKISSLFSKSSNSEVKLISTPRDRLKNLKYPRNFGRSAYLILLVPELVTQSIKKIVYIDADTLIIKDKKTYITKE